VPKPEPGLEKSAGAAGLGAFQLGNSGLSRPTRLRKIGRCFPRQTAKSGYI